MRYTQSHEWIAVDGNIGTVGITEYAQNELGDIVYIDLPKVGTDVKAGQEACVLESTKAAVDVYSPVSGKVIAVNESLRQAPASLKGASSQMGWLFKIQISDSAELDRLFSESQYKSLYIKL
jgi:glycine cleavage system H protein